MVELKSIDIPKVVKISGETLSLLPTQVVKISGEATTKITNAVIVASGLATSDTHVYSGAAFNRCGTATLVVDYLGGGSGVSYRIRGHAITDIAPAVIGSGMVTTSGSQGTLTVTGAFQYVDVGLANLQAGMSGFASAILATQ